MRFFSRAVIGLAAVATAAIAMPTHKRAAFPDPNDDSFYQNPANIATYANGQIIQSRNVVTDIGNNNKADSFQLSYRTTNTQKDAVANVATIFIPSKPASPPKIFSYQVYEDSTQLNCAPSYNYLTGFDEPNKVTTSLDTPIIISWALNQGYYVVSSDAEGQRSAFIAGYEEGMAILDAIRALKNYKSLPKDTETALYGYSGGAHATAWAVSLSASYAPDINIIGAAYGGTPTSAKDTFNYLNKGLFAGFAVSGVSGLALAHPDMESFIEPRLNAVGQQVFQKVRSRGYCIVQVSTNNNLRDVYTLVNDTNLLNEEPIKSILALETLVQAEASYTVPVPKFPRFMWHALPDEIVPFQPAADYVQEQCSKGANINWNVYPIAEHVTAEIFGIIPALDWLGKVYSGNAPKVACGGGVPGIAGVTTPPANDVLGSALAQQLGNLSGKTSAFGKPFGTITPS
ncbi:probable lipase precursor [Melanopsichium pennsylvanicum]|uniref:Lipase n=2 Tax=Melanopsichium pennsylvanicum TaxID=63383 RepID=A0AAJ5C6W3_9BASI|nr:probable lipase precursor [Melanopsichium pennsylvanicum 4]SNX85889.1 probable lipase precursor [Melanopsichium pennsylvanicum]